MLAEYFDRVSVVGVRIGIRQADNDRSEAPVILSAGWEHRGDQRIAFVVAQRQE